MKYLFCILVLSLGACTGSRQARQTAAVLPADFSLDLTRTACRGACPAFTAHIDAQGQVFYEGGDHAPLVGRYTRQLTTDEQERLLALLDTHDFWGFAPRFTEPEVFDLPKRILACQSQGRVHRVEAMIHVPPAFDTLFTAVEAVIGREGFEAVEK
ncbi:MAG: hypothetical protein OHK0039_19930 [Bacteroidia bacterium]